MADRRPLTPASSTAVLYATTVHGETFRPTWVSENITRIMGYAAAEALGPTWWTDRLHPEDRVNIENIERLPIAVAGARKASWCPISSTMSGARFSASAWA